jgi:hypothetical protein
MKVSKPPSGSISGLPAGLPETKRVGAKGFADKLAQAAGSRKAAHPSRSAARTGGASVIANIGRELKTGQLSPQAAIDRVVERIVARQTGPNTPAAVKELIGAALRQTLKDDPILAAKVRALSEGTSEGNPG